MKKIVINQCYGGFGLSDLAIEKYAELAGIELEQHDEADTFSLMFGKYKFSSSDLSRRDENLIKVVEELGEDANGEHADLTVVEIPDDDVDWGIYDYDGIEFVYDKNRVWGL